MKKGLFFYILLGICLFSFSSCSSRELTKYNAQFLILFNTVTEVVSYTETKDEFSDFAQFIHDNLEEYHQLYDIYNTYEGINNIKTINDNAGITPVKVDKKIIDLLLYSKEVYTLTNGKVNIALGPVLSVWHDYRTAGTDDPISATIPSMEELKEQQKYTDINKVIIDESTSTVYLENENMRLDVGAIAKGYATEQVTQNAIEHGYTDFLLSVGGNVRAVGGKGRSHEPWGVGIRNPDKESDQYSLYTLSLTNLSLVSSGNYERYYTVDGKRYHHIINADTLMPADYFTAVSVICEDSGLADTLSTAIFNMPYEEGKKLIESLDTVEALWIYSDGTVKYSEEFSSLIKK